MKYIVALSLIITSVCGATSCSKDSAEEGAPRTKQEILITKRWRLSAYTSRKYGSSLVTNEYTAIPACAKDDFLKFESNGSIVFDEGASKCNLNNAQSQGGFWILSTTETQLLIAHSDPTIGIASYRDFIELSASTLKLRQELIDETVIETYVAF